MTHSRDIPAIITEAAGEKINVSVYDLNLVPRLEKLGFEISYEPDRANAKIEKETLEGKARIFSELISMNACFLYGPGWYPSEVAEYLRDQGLLKGMFRRISGAGLGKPAIIDEI